MSSMSRVSIPSGVLVVEGDSREFHGTALEVVREMHEGAFFDADTDTRGYVDRVFERLYRLAGVERLYVPLTEEGAARALLSALVRVGLARIRVSVLN